MEDNNKLNILYFENSTMKGLYKSIHDWQSENQKRLHSVCIQKDNDLFCCISLTNPTEVIIVDGSRNSGVSVLPMYHGGAALSTVGISSEEF